MTARADPNGSVLDRIKRTLVGLRMPRALEVIDATVRRLEQGDLSPLEAIEGLLAEEFSIRENRRVKTALVMARLSTIKTLAGFDFTFQPSLDRNRVLALAQLDFVDRHEVVHLLGPPGTGKSHLAIALGVEAVKAGRSVYFVTLADLVAALAQAEREGRLRDKIRFFCRAALLIVDRLPASRPRWRQPVLPTGQRSIRAGRDDPHVQPGLRRVGRDLRRPRGGHRPPRPPPAPRRGHPDRGLQLPPASARRARPRAHPLQGFDQPAAAGTAPAGPAAQAQRPPAGEPLIDQAVTWGNLLRPF
jgi:hypothetical protein